MITFVTTIITKASAKDKYNVITSGNDKIINNILPFVLKRLTSTAFTKVIANTINNMCDRKLRSRYTLIASPSLLLLNEMVIFVELYGLWLIFIYQKSFN